MTISAALVATAAMSAGAVAASLGAPLVALAAYGAALAVVLVRPWRGRTPGDRAAPAILGAAVLGAAADRHLFVRPAIFDLADLIAIALVLSAAVWPPRRVAVAGALAAWAYLIVAGSLIGGTAYHSDAVVAAHAGAERVLAGRHPYEGFDLVEELARFGLPADYATPLEDGTRIRSLQYPALAVLVPAPFIALGLADVRALYLVEVLTIFGIVLFRAPVRWRPLALACCVGNLAVLDQFVNAGVDPLWALLVLAAWLLRTRRWSAVALGLAIAARQPAWLVAPFVLVWTWQRIGPREAIVRAAAALGIAVAIHIPFLLSAPGAVLAGVTTPALLPLEPWGVGPAKLLADTVGPAIPRGAFVAAAAISYLAGLGAFAGGRIMRGALVLPLVPLWLSWRALQSYFAFLPLFDLSDPPSGEPLARARVLDLVAHSDLARGRPARSARVLDLVASRLGLRARGTAPRSARPEDGIPLTSAPMPVDKELLEILACPLDKAPVREEGDRLICSQCGRRYPVRDGIPVMLVEEAELPEQQR